jgi:hypothetical protein
VPSAPFEDFQYICLEKETFETMFFAMLAGGRSKNKVSTGAKLVNTAIIGRIGRHA